MFADEYAAAHTFSALQTGSGGVHNHGILAGPMRRAAAAARSLSPPSVREFIRASPAPQTPARAEALLSSAHRPHLAPPQTTEAIADASSAAAGTTSSVSRSFSDLNAPLFICLSGVLCAARTAAQQPINLALARKQTCSTAASLSTLQVLRRVARDEGGWWRGLRAGMPAMVVGCALSEAIYLGLFEYAREALRPASATAGDAAAVPSSTALYDAVSGYGADVACRIVHVPLTLIAFRQMTANQFAATATASAQQQQQRRPVRGMIATARGVYREGGVRSLFAGLGATLTIGCQWTAVWWAGYGCAKAAGYSICDPYLVDATAGGDAASAHRGLLPRWVWDRNDNVIINSAASVVTSACTAVLFNPFLVVRTRLQVTPNARLLPVMRDVLRGPGGWRGFFNGTALNVSACVVDGFLASTSYEYAKLWSDRSRCAAAA